MKPVLVVAAFAALGLVAFSWTAGAGVANAAGCANESTRTAQGASALPECRAYEMVSPPNKNGTDVGIDFDSVVASPDGKRATFSSGGLFAGAKGGLGGVVRYLSVRGGGGWTTEGMQLPLELPTSFPSIVGSNVVVGLSADLSRSVIQIASPQPDPTAQEAVMNLYVQDNLTGELQRMTTAPVPLPGDFFSKGSYVPYFAGASADFSRIIFESAAALTPEAPEGTNLYESDGTTVRLVGLLPSGEIATGGTRAGAGASVIPGSQTNGSKANTEHTISADGSRIVFTVAPDFEGAGALYLRENGETTVSVSGGETALFVGATKDAGRIFFLSSAALGPGDTDSGRDLYEFDADTEALRRLSVDSEPGDGEEANAVGLVAYSEDGSFAYFVAEGQLVTGRPTDPGPKLYSAGPGGTSFVATLDPEDKNDWLPIGDGVTRDARVTPDGSHLMFLSRASLSGADNAGHVAAYLYDAASGQITCASCRPDGEPNSADVSFNSEAQGPAVTAAQYRDPMLRPISDDGNRLIFATSEALLPGDSNGKQDVYLFADGVLSLVSTGKSSADSYVATMTPSGNDIFFLTRQRLAGIDRDTNVDLYDARTGGGFESQYPPPPPIACTGEACRPPGGQPAVVPPVASATFAGPSNRPVHRKKKARRHANKKHKSKKGKRGSKRSRTNHDQGARR